jgi:hypothetical protein
MPVEADVAVAVAAAAPVMAFAGSWLGVRGSRRASAELDRWRRREETMRLMRWAAELAVDGDDRRASVGIAALDALQGSELLQDEDLDLVEAVAQSLLEETVAEYDQDAETGEDDEVAYVDGERPSGGDD